jgi:hypothetical protein
VRRQAWEGIVEGGGGGKREERKITKRKTELRVILLFVKGS